MKPGSIGNAGGVIALLLLTGCLCAPSRIAVADLNRDGKLDVVLGNDNTPGIVLVNEGDGRRFTATRLGATDGAVYGLAIGDVTAAGCPDIVAARSNARSVLYINACGGWAGAGCPGPLPRCTIEMC